MTQYHEAFDRVADITYREYEGSGYTVKAEHTVRGRLRESKGHYFETSIIVKGKVVWRVHWTAIKGYFPERGNGYF